MRLRTLVRLVAALVVLAVTIVTAGFVWRMSDGRLPVAIAKRIPAAWMPDTGLSSRRDDSAALTRVLGQEIPAAPDPGVEIFRKARESLALGAIPEARIMLDAVVNVFPQSAGAPEARRILGDLNLDEILTPGMMEGKRLHTVRNGQSLQAIADEHRTNIDLILHLNSRMTYGGLRAGEKLVVMPLNFRVVVDTRRGAVSLWQGARFISEYPVRHLGTAKPRSRVLTTIASRTAESNGQRTRSGSASHRAATKVIRFAKSGLRLQSWDGHDEPPANAVVLDVADMEEIHLLLRVGNPAEIR
jgi:hypothetical protein